VPSNGGRNLLVAVVIAAVLGFAAGWFARRAQEDTFEKRLDRAARDVEDRLRGVGK
jgi:hypothetical protein